MREDKYIINRFFARVIFNYISNIYQITGNAILLTFLGYILIHIYGKKKCEIIYEQRGRGKKIIYKTLLSTDLDSAGKEKKKEKFPRKLKLVSTPICRRTRWLLLSSEFSKQ